MGSSWADAGAVFRWSDGDRLNRVLVRDADVVMYDTWWPHLSTWGLADLPSAKRGSVSYYVIPVSVLTEKAIFVRSDPLTADERAVHRPDLPFAVVQRADTYWPADPSQAPTLAAEFRAADDASGGDGPQTSEAYLCPFGPRGGSKAGVRVHADNGTAFTTEELIRKAAVIQAPQINAPVVKVEGVGIYRRGLQRGIPSFYLWGAASRMHA